MTARHAVRTQGGQGRHRKGRPCLADDRGDISIEMSIIFPLVILITMMVVQAGTWYYAREIALSAARSGVAAGRGYRDSPQDGAQRAQEVLAQTAGTSLLDARASSSSTADRLTITVTGRAPSLLPFFGGISISQSASGPREHWTNR